MNCQVVSLPVLCGELLEGNHLHCGGLVLVDQVSEPSWVRGHPHQGLRGWLARLLPLTVEEDDLVGDGIHAEHHVAAFLAHFVERNWRRSISIEATISLSEYQLVLINVLAEDIHKAYVMSPFLRWTRWTALAGG